MWPHPAVRIEAATTKGYSWDLGEYPAMTHSTGGSFFVAGELHFVQKDHLDDTITLLDEIEGYNEQAQDSSLYVREIVECQLQDNNHENQKASYSKTSTCRAYAYFYAHPTELVHKMQPNADGVYSWSK